MGGDGGGHRESVDPGVHTNGASVVGWVLGADVVDGAGAGVSVSGGRYSMGGGGGGAVVTFTTTGSGSGIMRAGDGLG